MDLGTIPDVIGLESLPGCQYRMTSYDEDVDRSGLSPAYGIHLHDPRLLEYVGAPESARLLGRSPEYWLHHMGRDRTMTAAASRMTDIVQSAQYLDSLLLASTGCRPKTCACRSHTDRFRLKRYSLWRHLTECDGGGGGGVHYMAAMGLWRPPCTQGDTWTPAFVFMQRMHERAQTAFRTFRSKKSRTWCSNLFPSGEGKGVWLTLCSVYIYYHPSGPVLM